MAARLGRHGLLLQAVALAALPPPLEPIVLDHFETFVFSQDDRLGLGTAVGHRSWFVYACDPAPHRRGGLRAVRRPRPKHPLPEPIPASVVRSTARILRLLAPLASHSLRLISDDHPAYRAAVYQTPLVVDHRVFANPPRGPGADPRRARERDQAMFPVDLLHKLMRHSLAHNRRETIAFARRSNAALERAALMVVWRNLVKRVSERRSDPITPAMRVGATDRVWSWPDVLSRRLFPGRLHLPEGWNKIYRRLWITPAAGRNVIHNLRHAF